MIKNASINPKSLYDYAGKNLAPKLALVELSRNQAVSDPSSFLDAIQTKYKEYMSRDDQVWREHFIGGQMIANLREGKFLARRSPATGQMLFIKKDSKFNDNKTVGGLFQFYSTKLMAEWLSSNPKLDPVSQSDDDQVLALLEATDVIWDYYREKFFDTNYETVECLSAQDYGTWITRFRFDPEVNDIVCEILDFPACRWDIRKTAEESSYFIYESKCSNSVLEKLLNADIAPDDNIGSDENYGLRVIEQIAKAGGNIEGLGKQRPWGVVTPTDNENKVTEMWMQPQEYCNIDIAVSEETVAGITIPRGQSLLQMFPTGMCVVGINSMQTVIGLYAENHKDHIVSGRYHVQSFKGVGKGISDAVDVKRDIDNFHSQKMAFITAHATPATYYNQDLITEEQARNIGKPRKVIPVDFKNAPDGVTSINQAIQTITPANPGNSIWELGSQLENYLQMAMQVTDFSNGLPGVDNSTATGARIGDANAEMVLVPQHLNKAYQRKCSAKVILNLFKRHINPGKWFPNHSKNGITNGRYIASDQFDGVDIDFTIVANSEISQTQQQQKDGLAQLMQFTGGAMGLIEAAQVNPDIMGEMATTFGVKLSIPKKMDIARICRRRIEQAKKILQTELKNQAVMQMMGLPVDENDNINLASAIVSQISPPISPQEKFAAQKADWLADLLDSDELQYAPIELRYVIEEMIARQLQTATFGEAERAQDTNIGDVMANLPMVIGEQALNMQSQQMQQEFQQQQMAQQHQENYENQQQQQQINAQQQEVAKDQAEAQHQRALAMQDKQHANNLQLEAVKQIGQMSKQANTPQSGK